MERHDVVKAVRGKCDPSDAQRRDVPYPGSNSK